MVGRSCPIFQKILRRPDQGTSDDTHLWAPNQMNMTIPHSGFKAQNNRGFQKLRFAGSLCSYTMYHVAYTIYSALHTLYSTFCTKYLLPYYDCYVYMACWAPKTGIQVRSPARTGKSSSSAPAAATVPRRSRRQSRPFKGLTKGIDRLV